MTPKEVIEEIGHDGTEVWFPEAKGQSQKRSFHIRELQDLCMSRGLALAEIDMVPFLSPDPNKFEPHTLWPPDECFTRFAQAIKKEPALIVSRTDSGTGHLAAWDGEQILDPNGFRSTIEDYNFNIVKAFILTQLF